MLCHCDLSTEKNNEINPLTTSYKWFLLVRNAIRLSPYLYKTNEHFGKNFWHLLQESAVILVWKITSGGVDINALFASITTCAPPAMKQVQQQTNTPLCIQCNALYPEVTLVSSTLLLVLHPNKSLLFAVRLSYSLLSSVLILILTLR